MRILPVVGLGLLLASCGGSSGPSVDSQHAIDCVARINGFRAGLGLPALQRWKGAEACANDSSRDDARASAPHGSFGACGEFAQNTCPGWPDMEGVIQGCLQAMWDEGEPPPGPCDGACFQAHGHYLNMSSTAYTEVACGFHTGADGSVWSNQNFR